MLALRDEFAEYRSAFARYQGMIQNPVGQTLGDLVQIRREALSEVEAALLSLAKERTDSRILFELFDSVVKASLDTEDLEIKSSLSISGLLGLAGKKFRLSMIRGRASTIFDLWKKTMQIRDYHGLVRSVLGYEVRAQELSSLRNYSALAETGVTTIRGDWKKEKNL